MARAMGNWQSLQHLYAIRNVFTRMFSHINRCWFRSSCTVSNSKYNLLVIRSCCGQDRFYLFCTFWTEKFFTTDLFFLHQKFWLGIFICVWLGEASRLILSNWIFYINHFSWFIFLLKLFFSINFCYIFERSISMPCAINLVKFSAQIRTYAKMIRQMLEEVNNYEKNTTKKLNEKAI